MNELGIKVNEIWMRGGWIWMKKKLRSISEPWLMYENEVLWSDEMLIK